MSRLVVAGMGHVGLVSAAGFAALGHHVTGVDVDAERVTHLCAGRLPIFEPGLDDLVRAGIEAGRLHFSDSYAESVPGAEAAFLAVSTPTDEHGVVDLTHVLAAAAAVVAAASAGPLPVVVVKSTCPVGTGDALHAMLQAQAGRPVPVAVNPEFLSQGTAVRDVLHPDRVVIGAADAETLDRIASIHDGFDAPIVRTDPRTAEMVKYAANAFLGTKISFINEIAALCEALGADALQVATGIGLDPRIGPAFLRAGVGFGGSCLPKDLRALVRMGHSHGRPARIFQAALEVNAWTRERAVEATRVALGSLSGARVALLGLAFKPQTEDTRESPALDLARLLAAAGASVVAYDPVVTDACGLPLTHAPSAHEAIEGADAVLLVTDWPEFATIDPAVLHARMRGDFVLDLRNQLDPAACVAAGLRYQGVGRGPAAHAAPAMYAK